MKNVTRKLGNALLFLLEIGLGLAFIFGLPIAAALAGAIR